MPGEFRLSFVNHACLRMDAADFTFLCDPWFSGSVFNESWKLLKETRIETLDLAKLKYLWISHEHPDHFHFPTLKALRQRVSGPLTVFFQNLPDKAVRDALVKLGYSVVELDDGVRHEVEPGFALRCFACGGDSALVIHAFGTNIANTNDCGLPAETLERIRASCAPEGVELLLTQFGLAGYYANADDAAGLARARDFHLQQLRRYQTELAARHVVPFASYIWFCRRSNRFLNQAQVQLPDLLALPLAGGRFLVPRHGEQLWPLAADPDAVNRDNVEYWRTLIERDKDSSDDPKATAEEIATLAVEVMAEMKATLFRRRPGDCTVLRIRDLERLAVFDWKAEAFRFEADGARPAVGELASGDLHFLLKFPWGADTLNVTSAFHVNDLNHWQWFVWSKNAVYGIKKSSRRARWKNGAMLQASRLAAVVGVDLRDSRSLPWRLVDAVRR